MKLISLNNVAPTFKVQYFGIELTIPMHYLNGYIVTNRDGSVVVHDNKPTMLGTGYGHWWIQHEHNNSVILAQVELGETRWQETLMCLASNTVEKLL